MKKIIIGISILLLVVNISNSQSFQMGTIVPKGSKFKGVAGQIGNSVYTFTFDGDDLFINKCSVETMEVETSVKIDVGDVVLKKNSWSVLKVDTKIVFIAGVWDRDAPNKIYGRTVVESNGEIVAKGNLKMITEWKSPEYKGKKLTLGRDIKIYSSSEVEGLPTVNNKILVYYTHSVMISVTNGNKDVLMSCIVIDKDLNKLDEQNIEFDTDKEYHIREPKINTDGNFYILGRAWTRDTRATEYYCYIYDIKKKELDKKALKLDKFKDGDAPDGFGEAMINANNNLSMGGFYGEYGKYGVLSAKGFCVYELNLKGELNYDCMLFDEKMFNQSHPDADKKADKYSMEASIGMTRDYIIISKTNTGLNNKGEIKGPYFTDYVIFKKDENFKFKIVKTYTSEFTGSIEAITESNDKINMVVSAHKYSCEALNLTKPSEEVCLLNTFDLKGGVQTTFLYNIEKTNPSPRDYYRLKDGNCVFWGKDETGCVKINFK